MENVERDDARCLAEPSTRRRPVPRYALITTLDNVWAMRSSDLQAIVTRRADLTGSGIPSAIVEVLAWEDQPSPPIPAVDPDEKVLRFLCVNCLWDWERPPGTIKPQSVRCPECRSMTVDSYYSATGPAFRNIDV
jgi:hypothetical protein